MLSIDYELQTVRIDVGGQMVYADVTLRIRDGEKQIAQNQRSAAVSLQDLPAGPAFLEQLLPSIKQQVATENPEAPIYLPATARTITEQVRPVLGQAAPTS